PEVPLVPDIDNSDSDDSQPAKRPRVEESTDALVPQADSTGDHQALPCIVNIVDKVKLHWPADGAAPKDAVPVKIVQLHCLVKDCGSKIVTSLNDLTLHMF